MLRRRSDIDPFDEIQMIVLYCRTVIKLGLLGFPIHIKSYNPGGEGDVTLPFIDDH